MIRNLLIFLTLYFSFIELDAREHITPSIQCVKQLQPTLNTLRKLPEVENLLKEILKEGPLTIKYNDHLSTKFMGYWDPYNRTILITNQPNQSEANRIATMLFEMHNALHSEDFKKIDDLAYYRQINQEQYIRESEYIEYKNCLSTAHILNKGIQKGYFPAKSAWHVHDNFEDHYDWMKRSGHADWYAVGYKRMH